MHKDVANLQDQQITLGGAAYNLLDDWNLGLRVMHKVRFSDGGDGDAVFKDAPDGFADHAGRIPATAGTARQVQLAGHFMF